MYRFLFLIFFLPASPVFSQKPMQPVQPQKGPGGRDYVCDSVRMTDLADRAGGFWLFEPLPAPTDTAPVVLFFHGFGCYNPMIYGQWIRHLVLKGNVVIMPRYQDGLLSPSSRHFFHTAVAGLKAAIAYLQEEATYPLYLDRPVLIGHSYGGVLATRYAMEGEAWALPRAAALMTCQMGVNIFRGGRIREWKPLPGDLKVLGIVADKDLFVSRHSSKRLLSAGSGLIHCDLLELRTDRHGRPPVRSGHRSSHAPYLPFDNGLRSFSAWYALHRQTADAADFFAYWKLSDALIGCAIRNEDCEVAFGGTEAQLGMGCWSDGRPVRSLKRQE